jgi:hypothetical protein
MKKSKKLILISFLLIFTLGFAKQINFETDITKFPIYNKKNNKILNYIIIKPDEEINFILNETDTLKIYSRVVLNDKTSQRKDDEYKYQLTINDKTGNITKFINKSKVSEAISGENVSTYNFYSYEFTLQKNVVIIKNISDYDLIFRIATNESKGKTKNSKFVSITPNTYENEKYLQIGKKNYSYFTSNSGKLEFTLQGPITLKIISRLIFKSNIVNTHNYEYKIFDNGKLLIEFNEDAYKSMKAFLKNDKKKIPSTGDVRKIDLGDGIHNITIEDTDVNKDLMFRFYISK